MYSKILLTQVNETCDTEVCLMNSQIKGAWLQPVWSQYHIARAKAVSNISDKIKLLCLEVSDVCGEVNGIGWRSNNFIGLNHIVLFPGLKYLDIPTYQIAIKLLSFIKKEKIDVLCFLGYYRPETYQIILALNLTQTNVKILLFSESKEDDAPRSWWREALKSWIVRKYQAALVGGPIHKQYLIKLGMVPDSIFLGYDVVGNEAFHPDKIKFFPKLLDSPYFLAINRFVPKKNLLYLLLSYASYCQLAGSHAWNLVLCGDGPLRPQIEQYIRELNLQQFVHLPGFLQQEELLPYFAHASCFVHASIQEQWGLVVNEAMAAGLPVLLSNRCGCFEDLVIEGVNGFGFDPENSQQLTELMLKISLGKINLQKMSKAAFEHIQKFSPDYFAQGLVQAVNYALSHH